MLRRLAATPSFYIAASWLAILVLYLAEPVKLVPLRIGTIAIIIFVIISAALSCAFFGGLYSRSLKSVNFGILGRVSIPTFLFFSSIGLAGLYNYFALIVDVRGGIAGVLVALASNPLAIRSIAIDELGGAIQLSYFSWIAVGMGVFIICREGVSVSIKLVVGLVVLAMFFGNLTFVDRTRPVWLLVVSAITFCLARPDPLRSIARFTLYTPLIVLLLFMAFASFTGKVVDGGVGKELFYYLLGGFSYLNYIAYNISEYSYLPVRIFYPVSKVLESLGILSSVPPQVLNFYEVPFETNVGTFVEPLFSDGGPIFILLGVPAVIFFIDRIGLFALQSRSYFGIFLYSNLIFINLLSFFVAHFTSTPLYIFLSTFFVSLIIRGFIILIRKSFLKKI